MKTRKNGTLYTIVWTRRESFVPLDEIGGETRLLILAISAVCFIYTWRPARAAVTFPTAWTFILLSTPFSRVEPSDCILVTSNFYSYREWKHLPYEWDTSFKTNNVATQSCKKTPLECKLQSRSIIKYSIFRDYCSSFGSKYLWAFCNHWPKTIYVFMVLQQINNH